MDHHHPVRLANGCGHSFEIQRTNRAKVHYLQIDAFVQKTPSCFQTSVGQHASGHHGQMGSVAPDRRATERQKHLRTPLGCGRKSLRSKPPVSQKKHRILASNGGLQQPLRIPGVAGFNNPETRQISEKTLDVLAVAECPVNVVPYRRASPAGPGAHSAVPFGTSPTRPDR